MKRLFMAAVPLLAVFAAAAQPPDEAGLKKMKAEIEGMVAQSKVIGLKGGVMGSTVKGAPYSGVEVNESTQMLADGTRIHNESQTTVYRDGEGRVRRETPGQITIMDPVTGTTYFLDPKTQTARKATLSTASSYVFTRSGTGAGAGAGVGAGGAGAPSTFDVRVKDGVTSVTVNGKPVDPSTVDHLKLGVEPMMIEAVPMMRQRMSAGVMVGAVGPAEGMVIRTGPAGKAGEAESLGKQTIGGVTSEGTRHTTTLPAGAIGNDRPIQTVSERWYSPELQTVMMTKQTDPRSGEEIFRLTNVIRSEPSPDLFQVPPSYQMAERK